MIWTIVWFVVAAALVVIDQITKNLAVKYLVDAPVTVIPHVLDFAYCENKGMAFGLLSAENERWIFMTLSTVAIVGLMVYMIGWRPKSQYVCASLSLIIGGGIGNMIDRFSFKGILPETLNKNVVRDFIDVNLFGELWPWVFNVADACVCVGGAMLFLWCVVSIIKEAKEEKLAKAAKAAGAEEISESSEIENAESSENGETPNE